MVLEDEQVVPYDIRLAPFVPRDVLTRLAKGLLQEEHEEDGDDQQEEDGEIKEEGNTTTTTVDETIDSSLSSDEQSELSVSRLVPSTAPLNLPLEPQYRSLGAGAVFLLDLSGYTKFSMSAKGGADEVARVVTGLFTPMIEIVHSYEHCEILKFCGDALLCLCCPAPPASSSDGGEEQQQQDGGENSSSRSSQDEIMSLAIETAVACSLTIQEQVFDSKFDPKLLLHVGVAAGRFVELFVGGVSERFEQLVSGDPLKVLGDAVDAAGSGEVVIHTNFYTSKLVAGLQQTGRLEGEILSDKNDFVLARKASRASQLRCSAAATTTTNATTDNEGGGTCQDKILTKLLKQHDSSTLSRLSEALVSFTPLDYVPGGAEFRQCSVLFAALPDLDAFSGDDEAWRRSFADAQRIVEDLQMILSEYGGNMLQLLRDDKGTVAIGVYGLPTRSHEDDAARAVKTAMKLTSTTPCRAVGVATGDVFVGLVGSKQRCGYATVGNAVNMAARLMGACSKLDKPVLICGPTHAAAQRTSSTLAFEEKQSIILKGKGEKDIYIPTCSKDGKLAEKRRSSFLKKSFLDSSGRGRPSTSDSFGPNAAAAMDSVNWDAFIEAGGDSDNDDSAILTGSSPTVRSEELNSISSEMPGGTVCLTADAGSGKSCLAASFAQLAVDSNMVSDVLYAASDSTETETPFFTFKFLVNDACNQHGAEALFRKCNLNPRLAPLVNPLLETPIPTNPQCERLKNKARSEKSVHAVSEILTYLLLHETKDNKKKLLVIDDLHWMDDLSIRVFLELTSSDCSILATTRHEVPNLLKDAISRELRLSPLTLSDARVLAERFTSTLEDADLETLFERSGGNALFFTELLRAAIAAGGDISTTVTSLPSTVKGVIISRIDALPPQCIEFLKAASVFGRSFSPESTAKLLPDCSIDEVEELVKLALDTQLIEQMSDQLVQQQDGRKLRFAHALGGDAAYSLIPIGELARLHDKAANLVHSPALVEYHRVKAVQVSPTPLRAKLAVDSMANGTRDRMALGAMELTRAQERWEQARSILMHIENEEVKRELDLRMTLDEGRTILAWVGFKNEQCVGLFTKALGLTKRGEGSEEEIMALSGLWMHAMTNTQNKESAQKALDYAEELKELALNSSSRKNDGGGDIHWTAKEIYHVVWTEYGRRGRIRDMRRFLDPVLKSLTPHQEGKSVLGHNAETCATIFGAKVAWLSGQFADALPIAESGKWLTDEPFSIAHSRIWGVSTILAWNGQSDKFDEAIADKALVNIPPFHLAVRDLLMLYQGVIKGEISFGSVHGRFVKALNGLPWGEFPFSIGYALIQRGYHLRLHVPGVKRCPELCETMRLLLATWKNLQDNSDGWGPGLYQWVSGMLCLFEDPVDSSHQANALFDVGVRIAKEEDVWGVILLIETSRLKMLLQRKKVKQHVLNEQCSNLVEIRNKCTGHSEAVLPLAMADDAVEQVLRRKRQGRLKTAVVGALAVSAAVGGFLLFRRRR